MFKEGDLVNSGGRRPRPVALGALFAALAILFLLPAFETDQYVLYLVATAFSMVALASAFNLAMGYIGYICFGYYAFYGLGSMLTPLALYYGFPAYVAFGFSVLAAAALGAVFGLLTLRLSHIYFAISTFVLAFALQYAMQSIFTSNGIGFIILNSDESLAIPDLYWGQLIVAAATVVGVFLLIRSRTGLGIMAIREDEVAARTRGVNANRLKIMVMIACAVPASISGGLFSWYFAAASMSTAFSVTTMVQILLSVLVGGSGTIIGPMMGATLLSFLYSYFTTPYLATLIYAVAVIAILLIVPGGMVAIFQRVHVNKGGRTT